MAIHRENVIRNAEKYVSKGKLEAAIKEYRKVLAENPNDANTLNRVGDLYARIERFDEAVKLFSQIAEQYSRDGFFVKAIAIYKKIIKLDPTSLTVYERLAELYHKQGLLNEARTQYQVLADYYQKHDNSASAITIYQRMAELEPDNPALRLKLAELYESQHLTEKALREYRVLADLLLVNGSVDEAVQVYLKALEVGSGNDEFVRDVVTGLHDGGHTGAAAKVLTRAVEIDPAAAAIAGELGIAEGGPAKPSEDAGAEAEAEPERDDADLDKITLDADDVEIELDGVDLDTADDDETPSFDADTTFELPETSFDDIEDALASGELGDAETAADADSQVFTLDLDDDEIPESLVQPPADMLTDETESVEIDLDDAFAEEPTEVSFEATEAVDEDEEADEAIEVEPTEVEPTEVEPVVADTVLDPEAPATEAFALGDLEDFEEGLEDVVIEQLPAESAVEALPDPELELELEATADEVDDEVDATADETTVTAEVSAVHREEDLLAEAEVFAKYGLVDKARDRLDRLQSIRPDHLGGLALGVRLDLATEQPADIIAGAERVARLAAESGDAAVWSELQEHLGEAGYSTEAGSISAEPPGPLAEDDRISQLLEDLSLEAFDLPPAPRPRRGETPTVDGLPTPTDTPAPVEPPTDGEAEDEGKKLISLVDELGLDELTDELDGVLPKTQAAADELAETLDESGMSWLDDVVDERPADADADEAIFEDEDDFFDLAAELERELTADEGEAEVDQTSDQSLEEIIEGFKQGVAEHLSEEDYDTHFNLGIAYREMGLLDEAIGEFQLSSKDPRYLVESSSMLGICFMEKGLPDLAVRWYRKGLESPTISEAESLGLLYDMGTSFLALDDTSSAVKTFAEVFGIDSGYRDVGAKLDELRQAGASAGEA